MKEARNSFYHSNCVGAGSIFLPSPQRLEDKANFAARVKRRARDPRVKGSKTFLLFSCGAKPQAHRLLRVVVVVVVVSMTHSIFVKCHLFSEFSNIGTYIGKFLNPA